MAFTKIQIISNALSLIGKGPITAIADAGDFGKHAENMYDMTIESILAADDWRFATAIQELSKLVSVPIVDNWTYIYQLPANCLAIRRFYPDTRDFETYENGLIYSNTDNLYIEYRFKPDESRFPIFFVEYFIYYLAQTLALTASLGEISAKLEEMTLGKYYRALASNASSHPTTSIKDNPVINARGR